jgi:hypothetical protein
MKNPIIIAITLLLLSTPILKAQDSIIEVFIAMPDKLLAGMDAEKRTALLASPDSASLTVESAIREDITRTAFTNEYLALKTSEIGSMEIRLLPLVNNSNVVAVITTVCGPACDSRLDFYTTDWKPIPTADLFPEKDKNWFLKTDSIDSDEYRNAVAMLDLSPIKLKFVPNGNDIEAEYDIKSYLSPDDYKLLEPFLRKEPVILKWNKFIYKR